MHSLQNALQIYYRIDNLFTELIQNAEDATATEVCFLLDQNDHETEEEKHQRIQRPSLLVFNNGSFSDGDKKNITRLNNSNKAKDPASVGRFGLGFNTVYHITGLLN